MCSKCIYVAVVRHKPSLSFPKNPGQYRSALHSEETKCDCICCMSKSHLINSYISATATTWSDGKFFMGCHFRFAERADSGGACPPIYVYDDSSKMDDFISNKDNVMTHLLQLKNKLLYEDRNH